MIKTDIVIIGLSITSKLAALALATDNRKITIIGQKNSKSYDSNLVTFLSLNSMHFLRKIGIENLVDQSVPIQEISCSKLENYYLNNKFQINFKDKVKEAELGRVIINNDLNKNLDSQIKKNINIVILSNSKIENYEDKAPNKILLLDNEKKIFFKLLIIADKNFYLIEKKFKKNIIKKELKQTSIVMNVNVKTNNHAYQFFTKKGALALLPINKNSASIIWSLENNSLELEYGIKEISIEINKIFKNITSSIEVINLQKYKLNFEYAKNIISNSTILIGEAAHSLHPIAGQGLNLSIKDIETLKKKILEYKYIGYPLGSSSMLKEYEGIRQIDNTIYSFGTIFLDEIFKNQNYVINKISDLGIQTIQNNNFLKKLIVKSATGQ